MKPWLAEAVTLVAALTLAAATLAGLLAVSAGAGASAACAPPLALTLAFDVRVGPADVLADLEATASSCAAIARVESTPR